MNKWFESKNIANYAKTALLQAQKKIDQVLDIKEDEIIGKISTSTAQASLSTNDLSNANNSVLNLSSQSSSALSSRAAKSSNNNRDSLDFETETFFTTFLTNNSATNTPNQLSKENTRNNSPSLSENSFVQNDISIKAKEPSPKMEDSNKKDFESQLNEKSSNKTKNSKITKQSNQGSTLEIEKIEKQNWIQNYVDSNGSGSNMNRDQNENSNQTELNMVDKNKIDKTSTLTLKDSVSSISSALVQGKNGSTSTISANNENLNETLNETLTNSNASNLIQDNEVKTNKENEYASENENNINVNENNNLEKTEDLIEGSKIEENIQENSIGEKTADERYLNNDSSKIKSNISGEIDFVKIDANFSIDGTSDNTSSNEEGLETCVSSDIEVLSLPSTNGDQSLVKVNSINRISSLASINSNKNSKNKKKKDNVLLVGSDFNSSQYSINDTSEKQHIHNKIHFIKSPPPPPAQIITSPLSSQNMNQKTKQDDSSNIPNSDMEANRSLLEAREAHILKLNRQNVKLQEENDNLLSEIEKIKCESQEKIQLLQKQLNEIDSKYEQSINEKDHFHKSFGDFQRQMNEVKNLLSEKESQIQQLTQEGLKLSKQELNQSNIIKKLRAKEKENEELITTQKNEIQKFQKEIEELKKIIDAKQESESKNIDLLKKLEKTALTFEKELTITKSNLEDSEEKVKSLENTLQNTFKELAELHKANATKENIINESTSLIENQLKEEIQSAVEKERIISNKKQESLKWELNSVRADISRIEQQHALREEMLRKEIADLQQQLIDSENRNNELSQNISTATRPLLRQIENLQSSHANQIELLENAERNLIERLKEMQTNLCEITEKYRQSQESLMDLNQVVKTYDVQLQSLKIEKSKLNAEYQLVKTNLESYENEKYEKEAQHKILVNSLNQQIETLNREKKYIQSQLDIEKAKTESDAKKFQSLLNEYTKEKEQQNKNQKIYNEQTSNDSPKISKNLDFSSLYDSRNNMEFNFSNNPGALNILESLQSKLKQKDGEIIQLQKEIKNLEKTRESMAREMVNLTDNLEKAKDQLKEFPQIQEKYNKLNIEYNALLQLCGEKTEEVEELRLDLQDLKEMYKLQIEDLLKRTNV